MTTLPAEVSLLVFASACECTTLVAAMIDLHAVHRRRNRVAAHRTALSEAAKLLRRREAVLTADDVERIVEALTDQWTPSVALRLSVYFAAPIGLLAGLAAALLGAVR